MQILERTKSEVQSRAEKMSDFLRMEYLENCTRKFMDHSILSYCFLELSKLYEKNIMYPDAVKYMIKYEELCTTNTEKVQAYLKEIELLIKAGTYEKVEFVFKKAREITTPKQIQEIENKIAELYRNESMKYERSNKFSPALKAFEKLLIFAKEPEKTDIKIKMVSLYNKLGRVREAIELEKELQRTR